MSVPAYPEYRDSGVEWLGQVPSHWEVTRIGALFREAAESGEDGLPILTVSIHDGVSDRELDENEVERKVTRSEDATTYKAVRPGDLVYNMMRAWQGAFGAVQVEGMVSPAYVVARPIQRFSTPFVELALRTPGAIEEMRRFSKGITDFRLRLYWNEFKAVRVALPSTAEQCAIIVFLDRETGKIDTLVAEQEKLIELLKEKRQAVISHAVTKGLDPDVPMKDSGIEWLGEVPAHWEAVQMKHIVRAGSSITYGIVQAGPHVEDGIPYIKTSDMAGDTLPLNGYSKTSPEIDQSYARSKVEQGDLVIAIRATVGKCLPVPSGLEGANLTQGTAKISPGPRADGKFLLFAITALSTQAYFDSMSKGATFKEITLDALRRTPLALPPITEQVAIADFVTDENARIIELIDEARRGIDFLKERRSALISAAVTGKIDVRGLVAPEATEAA